MCGEACAGRPFGGDEASRWLSKCLGVQCRLIRHAEPPVVQHAGHAGGISGAVAGSPQRADSIAFANEAPLLMLSQASVDALNRALHAAGDAPVSSRHFRPNLVVEGGAALLPTAADVQQRVSGPEDGWAGAQLAGGAVTLRVTGPCARCAMVEIDPTSGAAHGTVLRALARHRRRRSRLVFGVFCQPVGAQNESRLAELEQGSLVEPIHGTRTK